jgi:hypothetical protein
MEEILSMFQRIEKRMRDCTLKRTLLTGIAHSLIPTRQDEVPAPDKGLKAPTFHNLSLCESGSEAGVPDWLADLAGFEPPNSFL